MVITIIIAITGLIIALLNYNNVEKNIINSKKRNKVAAYLNGISIIIQIMIIISFIL